VSIAYLSLGGGPPVVFASGIYGDAFLYTRGWASIKEMVDRVLDAGFRVVLYDIRGMGSSDKPSPRLDLDARVMDLEAVVDSLGLRRFALAALDLGGVTAIAYAARHSDALSCMLLLEPWASGAKKYAAVPTRMALSIDPASGDDWSVYANVLGSIVTGFRDHKLAQQLADAIKASCSPTQFVAYRRSTEQFDVTELLPSVTVPTLVCHSTDTVVGTLELAREVASGLGNAQFLVTEWDHGWVTIRDFLRRHVRESGPEPKDGLLSERELEVLRLIAAGKSNPQIAEELVISLNTVQRHVSNILDKTGAANRTEAALYARDKGLA
jgi:DNA-binding NarL/FixJ family response regulator